MYMCVCVCVCVLCFPQVCVGWILILLTYSLYYSLIHLLTHSLTHSPRSQGQYPNSSTQPLFYGTKINSLVGCAFCGSDQYAPSVPCLSFYLLFFMQQNYIEPHQHYPLAPYQDATTLCKHLCYCIGTGTIQGIETCE